MVKTDAPAGVVVRPYAGEADIPALVRIENRANEADGVPSRVTEGEMRAHYSRASDHFDPASDVLVAEVGGEPVAFTKVDWVDTWQEPLREYHVWGAVAPEWRRRGIGGSLLAANEARARELSASHAVDRLRVLGTYTSERQVGAIVLVERAGYEPVRWFFDMERPTLDDIPDLPLPDGIEVRPVTPDLYRRIWDADVEAFRDHWGGFDASEENLQRFLDSPEFDPSLWVIAWDGDEIAGGVINSIYPAENEALGVPRGWLDSVFTRRPWRRRGLARALIARSLALLRERGMERAVLGVDADNPSGALGLYENAGFAVEERQTAWRKPLDGA
jgi:mycothiol synthase